MKKTKNVLNNSGTLYRCSLEDNDFMYPVFVVPVDFASMQDFVEPISHDRFPYFPFSDVEKSDDDFLMFTFNTRQTSGPADPLSLYRVKAPVHDALISVASMSFSAAQAVFAFVDQNAFDPNSSVVHKSIVEFIAGPPIANSDDMLAFKDKMEKALESGVHTGNDEAEDNTVTFSLLWLEALSRAFAHTYNISREDTGTMEHLLSHVEFINKAAELVDDPSLDSSSYAEAYIYANLPEMLMKTFRATMDHAPADPELPEEDLGAEFESIMSEEDDLARSLMGVVDINDENLPADLRRMKLIRTWDESPLESDLPELANTRILLLANDVDGAYQDIMNMDLGRTEVFEHAVDHYGAGRVAVSLMVMIAEKAIKSAKFSSMDAEFTPNHDVMYNLKEWFNHTGHDIPWEWLALVEPLQNYDVSLSREFMMFEPRAYDGQEIPDGAAILPVHLITMLKTALVSTLALPMWEGYDVSNFKEDARNLGVNIDGFNEFVDWFDRILRYAHEIYAATEDVNDVTQAVIPAVLNEGLDNIDDLAWKVSMTIPVLSEICPTTARHDVGSDKWVETKKMFIINHLTTMVRGI